MNNRQSDRPVWQWEQGRGEYFQFENIVAISRVLMAKEGMRLSDAHADASFRELAMQEGRLSFLPVRYTVWRNYARVFKVAMLAVDVPAPRGREKVLKCTDVCRLIAAGKMFSATDYAIHVMRHFYLNGPVFGAKNYAPGKARIFPFCAIVRFLAARVGLSAPSCISPEEAKDFLFQNEVSGEESIDFFRNIAARPVEWTSGDQKRQVREMLIFASQCAFLKWDGKKLCLDIPDGLHASVLFNRFAPAKRDQQQTAHEEILSMASASPLSPVILPSEARIIIRHDPLTEGKLPVEGRRRAVNHIIIERSPKLREMFFAAKRHVKCDITGAPLHAGFPWIENILEIHHVTPLSSSVHAGDKGTRMTDLVALTPTSHRAVHTYYRQWMRRHNRGDFSSKAEARKVYRAAKSEYLSSGRRKWV